MNIRIRGGQKLAGKVIPSGGKNSAVALIPASLLINQPVTLTNVPEITDVEQLIDILQTSGSRIHWDKRSGVMKIDNSKIDPKKMKKKGHGNIRGSSLLWGPILGRFRELHFEELPGGCALGRRPLDAHLKAFRDLGVKVEKSSRTIKMTALNSRPGRIWLAEMSPTATENAVMFAVTVPGTTTIVGAASEPHVQDTCNFLSKAGAKISGVGSNILAVEGGYPLHSVSYEMLPDHYEIATYLALGAMTGGEVQVNNYIADLFPAINYAFSKVGVKVTPRGNSVVASQDFPPLVDRTTPISLKPQPWPGLPVDLLPLFIALSLSVPRKALYLFHNWMYEGGLFWTAELEKFGANVTLCDPHRVLINTGNSLFGTTVSAPYIVRATVALVLVAMIAQGPSVVLNADALKRGHPHFIENLRRLNADIEEI